jgi:hypothetical protein
METTKHKATALENGYLYRGIVIKRDYEYTNGQRWAYTFVMNSGNPIYELCNSLRGAKIEVDAFIEQGNYIAEGGWLFNPTCEEVQ